MSSHSMGRRSVMIGGGVAALGLAGLAAGYGLDGGQQRATYDAAAKALRDPLAAGNSLRELVRFATLAANSHNTQAWRFLIGPSAISILPDFSRRTPAVDPDDHHLFTSLGCATENLVTAAGARGFRGTAIFDPSGEGVISVALEAAPAVATPAFEAIAKRGVTRADYDGGPVPAADLDALLAVAQSESVEVMMITDRARVESVLGLVLEGSNAQYADTAYVAELKHWLRFNDAEALAHRDGLFSRTTGNPSLPSWIGRLIFPLVVTAKGESDKTAGQIRSSAGLAIFVSKSADKAHWIEAGRAYQRFGLLATTLGLKHAFINQAVEIAAVREQLATEIGLPGRRPDLIVRFGYGPEMPKSLRRSVEEVLA